MKKISAVFLSTILVLILISGCAKQIKNLNVCSDGSCTLTEDCNTCPKDCGCENNEYCDVVGICREAVCGDEICSDEERINDLCCEDCGCVEDNICNKVTQKCQEKIEVGEDTINNIVNKYLSENKIEGEIKKIVDTYYKDQTIKEVTIDCGKEESPYPCEVILFINEKGKIVEEMRTA